MEQYAIRGGNRLSGEVEIGGAKNAALAILAAAVMADEPVTIENVPDVRDTRIVLEAIEYIGAIVERVDRHTVRINGSTIYSTSVDIEFIKNELNMKNRNHKMDDFVTFIGEENLGRNIKEVHLTKVLQKISKKEKR